MKMVLLSLGMVALAAPVLAEPSLRSFEPGEADRLAARLAIKAQRWAQLPWQVSLSDAMQVAAAERKPIFLVVNTGNCLGYV
jgi:hypothetical protein